jgi:hypothetical protein
VVLDEPVDQIDTAARVAFAALGDEQQGTGAVLESLGRDLTPKALTRLRADPSHRPE